MKYLTKEDVLTINRKTISAHGGNFLPPNNFLHEDALDYLLDAVQTEMFGEEMYPTISDKAGVYMFNIISNHIFQDGNKRTGLEAASLFLRLNHFELKNDLIKTNINGKGIPEKGNTSDGILEQFTLEVASGKLTLVETQQWFKENIVKK